MTATARYRPLLGRARQMATGGLASVASGVVVTNVLRIISSLTLTRLLTGADYGVVGIITSITFTIAMLADVGALPFIVRHERGNDAAFLDEVWTIRFLRGLVLAGVTVAAAAPLSAFLNKGDLTEVIMVWGLVFVLDGATSLAFATAVKQQTLWRLSILETSSNVVSLIASITLALVLRSYWAIVYGMLIAWGAKVILSYTLFPNARRRFRISRERSREMWRFSRTIAMSSVLSLLILQVDKLFLGRMMPLATYGLYAIATTLAIAPEAVASPYAQRVLYPRYVTAVRETPAAFRSIYYTARRNVALLYAFAVGGLIGGAPLLIAILYDPRYLGVAPFLQLLAIRVALRMPNLTAYEAMIAKGEMRAGLIANVARIVWLALGVGVATWYGNAWLLVAAVATDEIPAALWYWWVLARHGILRKREEMLYLAVVAAGIAVGVGVLATANALFGLHLAVLP